MERLPDTVHLRIAIGEIDLQRQIKQLGGEWGRQHRLAHHQGRRHAAKTTSPRGQDIARYGDQKWTGMAGYGQL